MIKLAKFKFIIIFLSLILALSITALLIGLNKTNPLTAFSTIFMGAFGNPGVFSDVLVAWVPLLLATAGLLITFAVGLWNIGIEGQIIMGSVFTTWALRILTNSSLDPGLIITISFLCGIVGASLWAMLAAALKIFGGVNEIFGGLGLNFVAIALNLWLIFGPWKRPGVASMSGTLPFDKHLWLPTVSEQSRMAPIAVGIALLVIFLTLLLVQGTHFGLKLKAVGKNPKAAFLLGIPSKKYFLSAFILCGVCAGIAGAIQVTGVYHRLIPSISSGYGYIGLLVAMLANYQALYAAPLALFFAALNVGSIQLPIILKLDSSLSGIIQGLIVLIVLLGKGFQERINKWQSQVKLSPESKKSQETTNEL